MIFRAYKLNDYYLMVYVFILKLYQIILKCFSMDNAHGVSVLKYHSEDDYFRLSTISIIN